MKSRKLQGFGKSDPPKTKQDFILLDKVIPLSEHRIPDSILYSELQEDAYLSRIYQELNGGERGSYGQLCTHKSAQVKIITYLVDNGFKMLHSCGVNWLDTNIYVEDECNIGFFMVRDGLLIASMPHYLYFVYNRTDKTQTEFLKKLIAFSKEEQSKNGENRVSLIFNSGGEFYLEDFDLKPQKVDFDNYADSFAEDYKYLLDFIDADTAGLVLLSGKPGTGKSSLLKAICAETQKKVVYMPPDMVSILSDPGFQAFVKREMVNSILFIEDGENILLCGSNGERTTQTATLLNLTDGILGDLLSLHVIITVNIASDDCIDPALLRKGRLKRKIEFDALSIEKSQRLLDKLKIEHKAVEPMVLTDLYNLKIDNGVKKKTNRRMGFQQ